MSPMLAVAVGWAVVVTVALHDRLDRMLVGSHVRALGSEQSIERFRLPRPNAGRVLPGPLTRVVGSVLARRRARSETARMEADLPLTIDLIGLAMSAGVAPQQAVSLAARWGPTGTAPVLAAVDHATRVGTPFGEALANAGASHAVVAPLMEVLVLVDTLGAPAGGSLDRLAAEARADLRRDAEARARVIPVKLLFPLVFLVLPAFGLLTVVPALLASLRHT